MRTPKMNNMGTPTMHNIETYFAWVQNNLQARTFWIKTETCDGEILINLWNPGMFLIILKLPKCEWWCKWCMIQGDIFIRFIYVYNTLCKYNGQFEGNSTTPGTREIRNLNALLFLDSWKQFSLTSTSESTSISTCKSWYS